LFTAQLDNASLKETIPVDSADAGWVKLRLSDENFLKNNEYFNPQMVGQTYFGVMLHPLLPGMQINICDCKRSFSP